MTTKFYIGTSGWNYAAWQGVFYPKNLPKNQWLKYYSQHFKTIEINATFYRTFSEEIYQHWKDEVPHVFRYILKVPRWITHRFLFNCETEIQSFCRSASLLKNKLALLLLQLPPAMRYDLNLLKNGLLAFDNPKKVVVEFRHAKWLTSETKALLTKLGSVFCIPDSPKINLPDWVTTKTAYIRLHGRKEWYNYSYSKKELQKIADFAQHIADEGAQTIYIFFNNDENAFAIKNALYLKEILQ